MVARRFIWIALILSLAACKKPDAPYAVRGVMDLRNHHWEKEGPISLQGMWLFFWQEFLDPTSPLEGGSFIQAPGTWNEFKTESGKANGAGYATYALKILTAPNSDLALRIQYFDSSYRLYANGRFLAQAGIPGTYAEGSAPDRRPTTVRLMPHNGTIDLVIHVSNFAHRNGGFPRELILGSPADIELIRTHKIMLDLFMAGAIIMMGLYHLALFFLRRSDYSPLYFGLFCILIALRTDLVGERTIWGLTGSFGSFALSHRIEYATFYLSVPLFFAYTRSLFPDSYFRKDILLAAASIFGSATLLTFFVESYTYTQWLWIFQAALGLIGIYILVGVSKMVFVRRRGARVFVGTFVLLFAAAINDVLYSRRLIESGFFIALGLFVFIFTQAFLLSRLYAESFRRVEELAIDLTNSERRYRHLVEDSGEIILSLDPTGKILTSNKTSSKILGYSDISGRTLTSLVFEQGQSNVFLARHVMEERLASLIQTGRADEFPAHFKTAQGDLCELNVRLQRVNLEGGMTILANLAQKPLDLLARYCLEDHRHYVLFNSFHMGELLNQSLTAGLEARVSEEEQMLVRLALREMMINAIEHGNLGITFEEKTKATASGTLAELVSERLKNPYFSARKLHVRVDSGEDKIVFSIRDEGEGFDHRAMLERARQQSDDSGLYHGRGLRFALSFFDSVEYNATGNEVRLTRLFSENQ